MEKNMNVTLYPLCSLDFSKIITTMYCESHTAENLLTLTSIVIVKEPVEDCYRLYRIVKSFSLSDAYDDERVYELYEQETLLDEIWVTEKDKPFLFPINKSLDFIKKSKKFKEIVKAVINY